MKTLWMWCVIAVGGACLAGADEAGNSAHAVTEGHRPFIILKDLPMEPDAYQEPTAALVREGIPDKYGHEEWDAVVITQEFHQHVGIYTVLGAKMAVRARELLEAPLRSVKAELHTGHDQPLACVIDGIQGGLASTLGQGLVRVKDVERPAVAGRFTYGDRAVTLRLKPEYDARVQRIIRDATQKHGFLTPAYFQEVQDASYRVWADFDRRAIFEESPEQPAEER